MTEAAHSAQVSRAGLRVFDPDDLAALTIWQEARGEPYEGKLAVGEVVRERMRRKFFSDGSIEDTCLRKAQFSGWNGGDPNRVRAFRVEVADSVFLECLRAWRESASTRLACGALLYFAPRIVFPPWAADSIKVASIASHDFYFPGWIHPGPASTN